MQTETTTTTTTNGTTPYTPTETPSPEVKKTRESCYIAVVTYGSGSHLPHFVTSKTRTELTKLLAKPEVETVYGIFKGKRVNFTEQRKVTF